MQDLSGCKGAETVEGRYQNIRKRKLFKLFNESVKDLTYYSNITSTQILHLAGSGTKGGSDIVIIA
jgi:hypothetical protein